MDIADDESQAELLAQFEKRKRVCLYFYSITKSVNLSMYLMLRNYSVAYEFILQARQIQVSTDDLEVKAHLRQLGEPICKDLLPLILSCFNEDFEKDVWIY